MIHRAAGSCMLCFLLTVSVVHGQEKTMQSPVSRNWIDTTEAFNAQVAATVNGTPILNGDVLQRYGGFLMSLREQVSQKKMTMAQYAKTRESIVVRDLPNLIGQEIVVAKLKESATPDELKEITDNIDQLFEKELVRLRSELDVSDDKQLEAELVKRDTSLQKIKSAFTNMQMATGYITRELNKPGQIEEARIKAYYKSNPADFTARATVDWELIQISFSEDTPTNKTEDKPKDKADEVITKDKARRKIDQIRKELQAGASFSDLAKVNSDGYAAKDGGRWTSMAAGTLADAKLEEMLFDMPVGELSRVYEGASEFQLFRVLSRQAASTTPLADVRKSIEQKLLAQQNRRRWDDQFRKWKSEAVIVTKYAIADYKVASATTSKQD